MRLPSIACCLTQPRRRRLQSASIRHTLTTLQCALDPVPLFRLYPTGVIRLSTLAALLALACIAATIWLVTIMKPSSHAAYAAWSTWLNIPNLVVLVALLMRRSVDPFSRATHLSLAAVPLSGLFFIMDVLFVRPDPQGAIAVLLAPVVQGCAFASAIAFQRLLSPFRR